MRVAGYIRVSTLGQVEKDTPEIQKEAIVSYVEAQGWRMVGFYDEGAASGAKDDRVELLRLMEDSELAKFDVVVVKSIDRFGRSTAQILNNVEMLLKRKIKFISLRENVDFDTPTGKVLLAMMSAFAELERTNIIERTQGSKMRKVKNGDPTVLGFKPPYREWDEGKQLFVINDHIVVGEIRKAARDYLGGKALKHIGRSLREQGFRLGYGTLVKVLKQSCGDAWEVKFSSGKIKYKMESILDAGTIEAVKKRLLHNRVSNRTDRKRNPLTGFVKCGGCGTRLNTYMSNKQTGYRHYLGKKEKWVERPCKAFGTISADRLEGMVYGEIMKRLKVDELFEDMIQVNIPNPEMVEAERRGLEMDKKRLQKEEKALEKWLDAFEADESGKFKNRLMPRMESHRKETEELAARIKEKELKLADIPDRKTLMRRAKRHRSMMLSFMGQFYERDGVDSLSYDERVKLMHLIFDVEDGGVYITQKDGRCELRFIGKIFDKKEPFNKVKNP